MTPPPLPEEPQTFGQRFRDRGLIGVLGSTKKSTSDPNKMHFLEHLEEMRWVIFKSAVAFILGCLVVAAFLDNSVRLLQRPLISAVQDFGNMAIDLQATGLSEYQDTLEGQGVELIDLIHAKDEDLKNWGVSDPPAPTASAHSLCRREGPKFIAGHTLLLSHFHCHENMLSRGIGPFASFCPVFCWWICHSGSNQK